MLELSADDDLFTFTYEGEKYSMPAITVDDVDPLSEIIALPHAEMTRRARDYMTDACGEHHPDTADLLARVGLKNLFRVFNVWAGMSPGESKPSDDS